MDGRKNRHWLVHAEVETAKTVLPPPTKFQAKTLIVEKEIKERTGVDNWGICLD